MAPRKTIRRGQGFSLYDLQDDIASVVETLGAALERQGVPVDRDTLLLRIQSVIQDVGSGSQAINVGNSYGYPSLASDNVEVPYSVAGDLITIAHEHFKLGDKKEALKTMLTAMDCEDFNQISEGLMEMNRLAEKSNRALFANSEEETEDTTVSVDEDEDEDADEDQNETKSEDDADLSDAEIDDLVDDSEKDVTADDDNEEDKGGNASDEETEDDTTEETKPEVKKEAEGKQEKKPEGKSSKPQTEDTNQLEASHTSRVLANRLSLEGNSQGRSRATDFLKRHRSL